jgi:hypothetical protein
MPWILGSFSKDAGFIYLPALLAIAFTMAFPDIAGTSMVYAILATVIVDSGHVYTTIWRTYFHGEELRSNPRLYILTPVIIAATFFIWAVTGLPGLWPFVVYATLFHHVRQYYGLLRWYEKLNGSFTKASTYFLWAFSGIPIVTYHFRFNVAQGYYSNMDLFSYPNATLTTIGISLWGLCALTWLGYEWRRYQKGHRDWNRVLLLGFTLVLYSWCFLRGRTLPEVLFPVLFGHGIAYFGVMSLSLQRTQKQRFKTFAVALAVILVTSVAFGFLENWVEGDYVEFRNFTVADPAGLWMAALVGLYLTPLFTHFALDAFIWTGRHRESRLIVK